MAQYELRYLGVSMSMSTVLPLGTSEIIKPAEGAGHVI